MQPHDIARSYLIALRCCLTLIALSNAIYKRIITGKLKFSTGDLRIHFPLSAAFTVYMFLPIIERALQYKYIISELSNFIMRVRRVSNTAERQTYIVTHHGVTYHERYKLILSWLVSEEETSQTDITLIIFLPAMRITCISRINKARRAFVNFIGDIIARIVYRAMRTCNCDHLINCESTPACTNACIRNRFFMLAVIISDRREPVKSSFSRTPCIRKQHHNVSAISNVSQHPRPTHSHSRIFLPLYIPHTYTRSQAHYVHMHTYIYMYVRARGEHLQARANDSWKRTAFHRCGNIFNLARVRSFLSLNRPVPPRYTLAGPPSRRGGGQDH